MPDDASLPNNPSPDVLDGVFQRVDGPTHGRVYGRPLLGKALPLYREDPVTRSVHPAQNVHSIPKEPTITTEHMVVSAETAEVLVSAAERQLIEEACANSPALRLAVDLHKDDPVQLKKLADAILAGFVTKAKQDEEYHQKYGDVFQHTHYSPTGRPRSEPEFIVIGPRGLEDGQREDDLKRRLERLAKMGNVFTGGDFAGLEARILASQPELTDPHVRSAMRIYGVTAKDVTKEMRQEGKRLNFHDMFSHLPQVFPGASARVSAAGIADRIPVFKIGLRDELPPGWPPARTYSWDKYPSLGKDDYDEKFVAHHIRTGKAIDPEVGSRLERRRRDKFDDDKKRARLAKLPKDDAEARERCRVERATRKANPDRTPPVRVHFTKRERAAMKKHKP